MTADGGSGFPAGAVRRACAAVCQSDQAETNAQTPSSRRKPYWLSTAASTARMIEPIRLRTQVAEIAR